MPFLPGFHKYPFSLVFVCALGFFAEKSDAWGFVGHQITCAVAFQHLERDLQIELNRLIRAFAKPNGKRFKDFRKSCSFADTARHNARDGLKHWQHYEKFDHWHYLNVPRDTQKISDSVVNCRKDCVLHAIRYHGEKVENLSLSDAERGEALIFLAHWIADIHQPLHVGFADDRGGSDIEVTPANRFGSNLHSVWDSGLIKKARSKRKLRQYIAELGAIPKADKVAWARVKDPLQWAAESYALATDARAGYCHWESPLIQTTNGTKPAKRCTAPSRPVELDRSYLSRNIPVVERRLQQAGIRLAEHIEKLLAQPKPSS